ncbi:uncharacterized protein [Euwallacea similis]|uniref:uncharacterized protein n=1 Tax=Euwallacea similis TaxID=1736056 RepID=UPI00344DB489
MSGGVGRGRGWLNLKAQGAKSPGLENSSPPITNNVSPNFSNQDNRKYVDALEDFTSLINKIKQINLEDDGIKFNQKIRYIVEGWNQDCQNGSEVERSFEAIHHSCLQDAELATKLVHLIASRTFLSQEVREQNIRLMFLRKLQDNFEACNQLQSSNPMMFRNSIQLMAEFFNKARLANGQHFSFMATPLLIYLDILLESTDIADLKLFTSQLHLNGNALKQECPEKVAELLSKLRLKICSDKKYPKDSKLCLLLALEISNNRFAILPPDTQIFYQEQLGDASIAGFPGSYSTLMVQTITNNKSLDSYHSNVNVLQVSTEGSSDSPLQNNCSSDIVSSTNCSSSGFQLDVSQNSINNRKDSINSQKSGSAKSGRPILGIGARLQKSRTTEESWEDKPDPAATAWNRPRNQNHTNPPDWSKNKSQNSLGSENNWRERDNKKQGNDGNQKKDYEKVKSPPKSKKGWEHDDRFETDYS